VQPIGGSVELDALVERCYAMFQKVDDLERQRAQKLFDVLQRQSDHLMASKDDQTGRYVIRNPWASELEATIAECLDFKSIGFFVDLISAASNSEKQRLTAIKGHSKNHIAKTQVFEWCDTNMDRFTSMDDAAIDIAESFVPHKFRTVREWMTEWRKLRSTGTP
jgi:hypothetical protein